MSTPTSLPELSYIFEPTLIFGPINVEYEPPMLESHSPLIDHECELQFFNLNLTHEPYPILEPKLDLIQFYKSLLVPKFFTLEFKSTVSQYHIPLLDQSVEQDDFEMIFHD